MPQAIRASPDRSEDTRIPPRSGDRGILRRRVRMTRGRFKQTGNPAAAFRWFCWLSTRRFRFVKKQDLTPGRYKACEKAGSMVLLVVSEERRVRCNDPGRPAHHSPESRIAALYTTGGQDDLP